MRNIRRLDRDFTSQMRMVNGPRQALMFQFYTSPFWKSACGCFDLISYLFIWKGTWHVISLCAFVLSTTDASINAIQIAFSYKLCQSSWWDISVFNAPRESAHRKPSLIFISIVLIQSSHKGQIKLVKRIIGKQIILRLKVRFYRELFQRGSLPLDR